MTAALPPWVADTGAIAVWVASFLGVLVAASAMSKRAIRSVVKPDLDLIHKRIDEHMGEEEMQLERLAISLEIIARATGAQIPDVRRD